MKRIDHSTLSGILYTDQYQLTMAQLYFRMGLHEVESQFDHFFRDYPDYGLHKAGYAINAGLGWLLDWMAEAHFRRQDLDYLAAQTGQAGTKIFAPDFLEWLRQNGDFKGISLRAIPEGRVVHPNVPLTVVRGPLAMAQILETPLLNQLNFQTLIATKAARILDAGLHQQIIDFGLRRAQDRGANAGARAALIGGADASSNVGLSHVIGYPPKGTHAHSMVQVFLARGGSELDAFRAYADVYPDDCLLLVDTIDTLESGVPNAIEVFQELKRKGHQPLGIRLDSGDLAHLSIQAARLLNEAGFNHVKIVLSNQLDELVIWQIVSQIRGEAPRYGLDADSLIHRLIYGVGTRLITSAGDSALDGVYKLTAVEKAGKLNPAIKISESLAKIPNPGAKFVSRVYDWREKSSADLLSIEGEDLSQMDPLILHHPIEHTTQRAMRKDQISRIEPLLVDILDHGNLVYTLPTIDEMRERRIADLDRLDPGIRRIVNPHVYHVSLTPKLWELKQDLIAKSSGEIEMGE